MATWIDTHCHLDFLNNPEHCLAAAHAAGVAAVVVPAVSPENFARVAALAQQHAGVFYALGLHPCSVDGLEEDALLVLENALRAHREDPKLVAVGEIGLDFFLPTRDKDRMMHFYTQQLRLARDFDLPVVLHVRRAQDQVCAGLRRFGITSGIAHAFNGSLVQAQAFLRQGLVLGFGGAMTFSRALQIRRLAQSLPEDAWVLETDSPDIAPAWLEKGATNTPDQTPAIGAVMAGLRGLSIDNAAACSSRNAYRALPRLSRHSVRYQTHPNDASQSR
jgi:TatD DNase family protein